jgi:hypothetical protein
LVSVFLALQNDTKTVKIGSIRTKLCLKNEGAFLVKEEEIRNEWVW